MTIGVISDTHGLLRPEAIEELRGSDLILHAGDVGRADILDELAEIAPVRAIRGNVDKAPWARSLPERLVVEANGRRILMIHNIAELESADPGIDAVIFGHSHKPSIEERDGILYLNPGSAGPRRFSLPISLARMYVGPESIEAELRRIDT